MLSGLGYLLWVRHQLLQQLELLQQQQQLRQLRAEEALVVDEMERRQVGTALHNGLGQLLSAAKMSLSALEQRLPLPPDGGQQELLASAIHALDNSVREVRRLSQDLLPNAFIRHGLAGGVRDLASRMSATEHLLALQVEVVGLSQERLALPTEILLFRAIQELVLNAAKHAQATEMTLQLICHEQELVVVAEDNGIGFDPAVQSAGHGLRTIEARMAYLGGRALFDAAPGRGTTITLELPLPRADSQ
ncbi:hypothetical protein KBK19_10465 [Microvirga sp. STR05]|uniref:Oxygen sensor histidine kinase NreB n=1 Tax=Hymenobacter duratus TaxID=2771356 RepID=A0ABR8JIM3_9BACT|nr:ATP-binding protein [Hymenobacter duratus]MBD2715458.1 hypothetical protein [Hymenobacter duratus]MBR7950366.1 hypothetical protein [Microvirga sp. STR05]